MKIEIFIMFLFLLGVMCHSDKSSSLSAPLSAGNYLHKKFKKVATADDYTEVAVPAPVLSTDEYSVEGVWRHKCPYCKTVCTKPSALAKHLQVHSDERPFPCETCGFAFKTKSNLSKHCKSQSHTERLAKEPEEAKPKLYKPKFRTASIYTKLEEDKPKDPEPVTETLQILPYKQEDDSSQPLNLSVPSIKKCEDKISPIENGQTEFKDVYKLLFNQIIKCNGSKEQPFCEMCSLKFNSQEDLIRHICDRNVNGIKYPETKTVVAMPLPSPGPLLGRTPLVEFHRSKEPDVSKSVLVRVGNLGQQQEMLAIFQGGRAIPFVPGMPGPHTGMPHQLRSQYEPKQTEPPPLKKPKIEDDYVVTTSHHQVTITCEFYPKFKIELGILLSNVQYFSFSSTYDVFV